MPLHQIDPPTSAPNDFGDFRLHLQAVLAARCRKNPRYSLRAFAESLGIGSSDLSKLIRRQRTMTEKTLLRLAVRLELEPTVTEAFRAHLVAERRARRAAGRGPVPESAFKQLSLDSFHVLADWYHMAVLEVLKVSAFEPSNQAIAKALGITVSEVNIAVQRLQRLSLLEIDAQGRWHDRAGATSSVSTSYTDVAKKKHQRQILEKAIQAVETVPFAERDQSAMLMAVNTKHLPAARALIKDFRRQLCALMETGDERDQVYYLSVSLFPIMKKSPASHRKEGLQ